MIKKFGLAMAILVFTAAVIFPESGKDVLDRVEAILTAPKDTQANYEMSLGSTGSQGSPEKRIVRIWTLGKDKRVIKFITPSSIKNVGVLALNGDEMYIYLPAYQKDRRIQGDMRDNDFQGTDFSYREMSSYNYSKDYDADISKEDSGSILLTLTKKPESDVPYDKLLMMVDRSIYVPKTIEMYYGGSIKKKMTVIDAEKNGNYWTLVKIRMENFLIGHYTEIVMKDVQFDQGLENKEVFTRRFLSQHVN